MSTMLDSKDVLSTGYGGYRGRPTHNKFSTLGESEGSTVTATMAGSLNVAKFLDKNNVLSKTAGRGVHADSRLGKPLLTDRAKTLHAAKKEAGATVKLVADKPWTLIRTQGSLEQKAKPSKGRKKRGKKPKKDEIIPEDHCASQAGLTLGECLCKVRKVPKHWNSKRDIKESASMYDLNHQGTIHHDHSSDSGESSSLSCTTCSENVPFLEVPGNLDHLVSIEGSVPLLGSEVTVFKHYLSGGNLDQEGMTDVGQSPRWADLISMLQHAAESSEEQGIASVFSLSADLMSPPDSLTTQVSGETELSRIPSAPLDTESDLEGCQNQEYTMEEGPESFVVSLCSTSSQLCVTISHANEDQNVPGHHPCTMHVPAISNSKCILSPIEEKNIARERFMRIANSCRAHSQVNMFSSLAEHGILGLN